MSIKDRLNRKHILLIVLGTILLVTLVAGGSAVYAKYAQTKSAGSNIDVRVESNTQASLVVKPYESGIPFDEIPPVYPFG